jgi:hypothetical protein
MLKTTDFAGHLCYLAKTMLGSVKNSRPLLVFLVLMIASLVGLLLLPPIAQDQSYLEFARPTNILWYTEFLECRFEFALCCDRSRRVVAASS